MQTSKLIYAALLLSMFTASTGCKRALREAAKKAASAGGGDEVTTAPKPMWKDMEVTFAGANGRGRFFLHGMQYDITFNELPAGTKLTVNGKPVTATGSMYMTKVDLSDKIAVLSPKDAFDSAFKLDPQIKVEIEFSPTAKVTLDAPPGPTFYGVGELFKKAADTPVTFAGYVAPAEHTILSTSHSSEVLGPAKTVKEIDWVAVSENLPSRKGKICTGYKKSGTDKGPEKSYQVEMVDQKVSIYDVSTSKLIDAKEFKAKDDCPMMTFGGAAKTYPSQDEQKSWLRTARTKKK